MEGMRYMMNRKRSFVTVLIFLYLLVFSFCCYADDSPKLMICQDSSGKEGVQNDLGEWIIPPIYDEVSYDGNVYWVFIERTDNEQKLVGIIDTSQGFAIAAHYDEILIGDSLIVAYDPLTHVYDIFDSQCRLIYTLPGKYDYVVPNGECCVDVVDLDAGIYTIKIPSYLITNH